MISKTLKTIGIGIALLILFLVITFPFERVGPKVQKFLDDALYTYTGITAKCSVSGLRSTIPFIFHMDSLVCVDEFTGERVAELSDAELVLFPKAQSLSAETGKGRFKIKGNAGFKSMPTRFYGEFTDYPAARMFRMIMGVINRTNPALPKYLKAEGKITGVIDWPLTNLQRESGKIDLQFSDFKVPTQSQLDLLGLKDLTFSKAVLKVSLAKGKFTINDAALISPQLAGKAEGSMDIAEDLRKSVGNLTFKWKIEKSDAVMSSLLGQIVANNCPSPDSEGFCTRRVQRMSDLGM
jgi:hypothetical protein